jgi:hypothetical protein
VIKREPELDLLLSGDLLALSPLEFAELRERMLEGLRDQLSTYTQRDPHDPGVAFIEALAACVEVMGFYHDRILTESKLGSALLLQSVAQLGEIVGYAPAPPLAAVAQQFFEALGTGQVPAGTRVAGSAGDPPVNVIFETATAIPIATAFNKMELSPLLPRYAGAVRAIVALLTEATLTDVLAELDDSLATIARLQNVSPAPLPLDDFRKGHMALLNGPHGLELGDISSSRRGGVAFARPLLHSYDESTTTLSRATRIRHLRFWRPLGVFPDVEIPPEGEGPDQVIFELSDRPILHIPDAAAPDVLKEDHSTLEVFVFDAPGDIGDPSSWDPNAKWTEVPDFSASEASDRHYRLLIDDRLTTNLVLRRRLGFRTLLDDTALSRVYVRFTPAVGRVVVEPAVGSRALDLPQSLSAEPVEPSVAESALLNLDGVTLSLYADYFENAMVRPSVPGVTLGNATTWAVTKDEMGLEPGDQIVIQGSPSGDLYFRTLTGVRGRYLDWGGEREQGAPEPRPVDEHAKIDETFDPTKATIAPLAAAAAGQAYPLWEAYYKQAKIPDNAGWVVPEPPPPPVPPPPPPEQLKPLPSKRVNDNHIPIQRSIHIAKGSTFLLLENSSNVHSSDYLLVGRRLHVDYRDPPKTPENEDGFDRRAPWLTAEIVQAVEVQGNLVRIKDPIGQEFYRDRDMSVPPADEEDEKTWKWATDVVVVPAVASVYYGDTFVQHATLDETRTFPSQVKTPDTYYVEVKVLPEPGIDAPALRQTLGWEELHQKDDWDTMFNRLFLAVAGQVVTITDLQWSYRVTISTRELLKDHVSRLQLPPDDTLALGPAQGSLQFDLTLSSPEAAQRAFARPNDLVVVVKQDAEELRWATLADVPDSAGEYCVEGEAGRYFLPLAQPTPAPELDETLLAGGGVLRINWITGVDTGDEPDEYSFSEVSDRGLFLGNVAMVAGATALDAVAVAKDGGLVPSDVTNWSATWRIPTHFKRTGWFALGSGVLVMDGSSYDKVSFRSSASNLTELVLPELDIVAGEQLNPLTGVNRVWAQPTKAPFSVAKSNLRAIWRFHITSGTAGDLDNALFSTGQLLVRRPSPAGDLLLPSVEKTPGDDQLRVTLPADDRRDLADPSPVDAYALAPERIEKADVALQGIWAVSGTFAPSEVSNEALSGVAFGFAPANVNDPVIAARASLFKDGQTDLKLWLRPISPLSDTPFGQTRDVYKIIQYFDVPRKRTDPGWKETPDDSDPNNLTTALEFFLPTGWPGGLTPPTTILATVQGTPTLVEELVTADSVTLISGGKCKMVFGREVFKTWSEIRLALRDWSDQSVTLIRTRAMHVDESNWPWGNVTSRELLFLPGYHEISAIVLKPSTTERLIVATNATSEIPSQFDFVYRRWIPGRFILDPPEGRTGVLLPSFPMPGNELSELGYLVITADTPRKIIEGSILILGNTASLEVYDPLLKIYPPGQTIPAQVPLRFVYDVYEITTPSAELGTGTVLHVRVPKIKLETAGIDDPLSRANGVVFHNVQDQQPDFNGAVTGSIISVEIKVDNSAVLELSVNASNVFLPDSQPIFPSVSFAQSWQDLLPGSMSLNNLLVALGPAPFETPKYLPLEVDDELLLWQDDTHFAPAKVKKVHKANTYELDNSASFTQIRLRSVNVQAVSFDAEVKLKPPSRQPPWLFTMTSATTPEQLAEPIEDTLLSYDEHIDHGDGYHTFRFETDANVEAVITGGQGALYLYTNQQALLRADLYVSKGTTLDSKNFLKSPNDVNVLLVKNSPPNLFRPGTGPSPSVFISDTEWVPSPFKTKPAGIGSATGDRKLETVQLRIFSQSIIFNSGNFIPVTGANPGSDDKIIANALRIYVTVKGHAKTVVYNSGLSQILKDLEEGKPEPDQKYLYSFNKVPGGAFTLNFLMMGDELGDELDVAIFVEYAADRKQTESDSDNQIYEFETGVERLDPQSQLVVLDSGELKTDDYLFLHTATEVGKASYAIQWTRVRSVAGPVIEVDPVLNVGPLIRIGGEEDRADFRRYSLSGFARPPKPVPLDKDYYALLKDAVFSPVRPLEDNRIQYFELPVLDQLVIDRKAKETDLLETLIPGDHLLIWNEDSRTAWHAHRIDPNGLAGTKWFEWPLDVHEAVVKSVDLSTRLLLLSEPLPKRFCVRYNLITEVKPPPAELEHKLVSQSPVLRILPHHRAPFQGGRRRIVLGSGDKSRKFARYTGVLDPDPGLGTVPLAAEWVYAGNIEVLSQDPRSGEFNRWVQFADLNKAERKDRAFSLGVDRAAVGDPRRSDVPFSVSFGDGKNGQLLPTGTGNVFARVASVGGFEAHVDKRRALRILAAWKAGPPFPVPPDTAAAPSNLWLRIEFGASRAWCPSDPAASATPFASDPGQDAWRSAMVVETMETVGGQAQITAWREVDQKEAEAGCDGIFVRGVRPGVVDVFFFSRQPITTGSVQAWEAPDARLWVLDADFYGDMIKSDPTRAPGSTKMGLLETDGIAPGSLLALSSDEASAAEVAQVVEVDPDTWSVVFSEGLTGTYPLETSFLRGNIVRVDQGNSEPFIVGSSDGSTRNLRLPVNNRATLLYAVTEESTDPQPGIKVLVSGVAWARVADFDKSGPRDRVFCLDVDTSGKAFVTFGDGVHGAVPPAGTNNITVLIRTGDGEAGNIAAGGINKLRDSVKLGDGSNAVKATRNLTDAAGGRKGETVDQARETLLGRSVGFERIVSIEDVSRVALEVGEVLHARLDPTAPAGTLSLVVALQGRRAPSDSTCTTLRERIGARMPATADLTLQVTGAKQKAVYLDITVSVSEGYRQADVLRDVKQAFGAGPGGFFAAERWPVGEPLQLGDVYEALFAVAGLAAAQVTRMSTHKARDGRGVADMVNPGPAGVIRCDNDPVADPHQEYGSIVFDLKGGVR